MGRTLNLISLAGISFAVGMVVDNSLVVLENIFSKLEKGEKNPFTASINGAKEVGGAILASTLTTFAVFLPILFLSSEIGQLFKDIALAISISVIISFFVSLTFIPGLASRILVADTLSDLGEKRKFFSFFDKISEKIKRNILNLLDLILQKSDKILKYIITILSTTLLLFFLFFPKIEYLPEGNRNLIISVLIPPQGYNITKIKEIGKKAENKIKKFWNEDYKKDNKIKNFFFVARPKSVFMGAVAENPQKIKELIPEIKKAGEGFPGFITVVNQSSLFSRSIGERRAIDINIQGKEYESIINLSRMIFIKLKNEVPNYQIRPKPSLTNSNPEIIIKPNNLKLNQVNMTTSQLGLITNVILDGAKISKYNNDGKEIDIILRANKPDTISSNMLNTRYIYNDKKLFPLSYVSDISIINSPQQINHVERERTIKLQVSPDEKTNIEEALDEIKKIINSKEIKLYESNNNLQIGIKGIAGKLNEAKSSLSINFIYAILISFFLLSSLFQNFIYPLIVLIIVPLSCLAGIYGLKIMNLFIYEPLNMLSMLGFIILLGIVVNNSILIVYKSINNLRQGMEENESIKEAVKSRIRPIFMTTLTTSFGLLPLAVIPGAGAELYRGLAVIILFGLLISTLFTLFLTPMSILVMNRYFKIK
jgi:HAE1 family hydrophobic/amphiphilic exporter-1